MGGAVNVAAPARTCARHARFAPSPSTSTAAQPRPRLITRFGSSTGSRVLARVVLPSLCRESLHAPLAPATLEISSAEPGTT